MIRTVEDAYETCERLARAHYENFTVGSALLPRGTKKHLYALYAFARTTDDLGDEAEGDRIAQLKEWERDLRRCFSGHPVHPVLLAVQETVRQFDIPADPFLKLIEANVLDQTRTRHETFKDLLFYCERSANPCGRLVLYLFDVRDEESFRLSDATCTALQLTNFWQDLAVDWSKGRVYLPQEDLRRFAVSERHIAEQVVDEPFRRLMAFEVDRTRAMFREGMTLIDRLRGRAKFDIRLFTRGGMRVLDLIERNGYDVFRRRPTLSKLGKAWLAVSSLLGVGGG